MDNKQPLVTVVIALYNKNNFFENGIKSVINQTYPNIEIILVDDGSNDGTEKKCDIYLSKYSNINIQVFHTENRGPGLARNVGIDNAHGKYIYFFDIDDEMHEELIEYNVRIAEKYNTDINFFSFSVSVEDNKSNENIYLKEVLIKNNEELKKEYCKNIIYTKHGNGFVWNKFYLLEFIKNNEIYFENQRIQEDEIFNNKLYPIINKVYISSRVLYNYKIHSCESAISRYLPNKFEMLTDVYSRFLKLYICWNLNDEKVKEYIFNRYYSGILDSLTFNIQHENNTDNKKEKFNRMKSILDNENVEALIDYYSKNHKKDDDRYYKCIKNKRYKVIYYKYKVYRLLSKLKHNILKGGKKHE